MDRSSSTGRPADFHLNLDCLMAKRIDWIGKSELFHDRLTVERQSE